MTPQDGEALAQSFEKTETKFMSNMVAPTCELIPTTSDQSNKVNLQEKFKRKEKTQLQLKMEEGSIKLKLNKPVSQKRKLKMYLKKEERMLFLLPLMLLKDRISAVTQSRILIPS